MGQVGGTADTARRHRLAMLGRFRYRLLGASLIGVFLPAVLSTQGNLYWRFGGSTIDTLTCTFAAMSIGAFILLRMARYPGVRSLSFILSTFAATYAITLAVVLLLRLDYSRAQFGLSFVLTVAWFYFAEAAARNARRIRLLLLPFGAADRLTDLTQVDWIVARTEEQLSLPLTNGATAGGRHITEWAGNERHQWKLPPGVSGIVTDLRADLPASWERFVADCALRGVPIFHSKEVTESLTGTVEVEHLSENTFGTLLPNSVFFRAKGVVDAIVALIAAPAALLITAAAAIAIKLEDGGPIIFSQPRVGYRGETFMILKLRTMRVDADLGPLFTKSGDSRITKVGRFLRKYRIDELPQIINVLRGEMSWIGPRPEAAPLASWYASKIPFYSYRHIVRPGITGWAQVHQGNVAEIDGATGKLRFDFFYIKHFSPWLDVLILAKTVRIILTGFGAR